MSTEFAKPSGASEPCLRKMGLLNDLGKRRWRGDVVGNAAYWNLLTRRAFDFLPFSKQPDQYIGRRAIVEQLGNKVEVRNKRRLQNDRHITCVKKFDRVVSFLTTVFLVLNGKVDTPSLKVNDDYKNKNSCHQVCQVGQVLSIHGLLDCLNFVIASDQ